LQFHVRLSALKCPVLDDGVCVNAELVIHVAIVFVPAAAGSIGILGLLCFKGRVLCSRNG
jgi:hypothetical protein